MPSYTITGHDGGSPGGSRFHNDQDDTSGRNMTVNEAATLQGYPRPMIWDAQFVNPRNGKLKPVSNQKKFLIVGNAVPPRMVVANLAHLWGVALPTTREGLELAA